MSDLILNNIKKNFGDVEAVKGINYKINDGEMVALLGPSGCGKTTTLLMIAGIYLPTEGNIMFGEKDVTRLHPKDRNIGMVFQSYALYPSMTVYENISFPLRLKKVKKSIINEKVKTITELLGIYNLLDRKPGQLSGGQQQRVALARGLIKEPEYLLLDEPLSNLDAKLRINMRTELKRIHRELGLTTILVTHDQEEAMSMADKIILMEDGQVRQIDDYHNLYYKPEDYFVAGFMGAPTMNFIDMELSVKNENFIFVKDDLKFELSDIDLDENELDSEKIIFGIRPEHLYEVETNEKFAGEILSIEPLGREILIVIETTIGRLHYLFSHENEKEFVNKKIGDKVKLDFESTNVNLFDSTTKESILN